MSHFNLTSKSFTSKTKRGLSLSLEKKKPEHKIKSLKEFQQQKQPIYKSHHQSPISSNRKNRIKFVQSYQKNQSSSKYEKGVFFKTTDEDIKLGGNKKSSSISRNTLMFPRNNLFGNGNFTMESNFNSNTKIPQFTDKKVLRQSKVMNLNSNISYFQNVNNKMQKEQNYDFLTVKDTKVKNISQVIIKQHKPELINPFQSFQISTKNNYNPLKEPEQDPKQKLLKQTNIHPYKLIIDQSAIQKLKKVQTNIDKLLQKVSQTRAYLLR